MSDGPIYRNIGELLDAIDTIAWCQLSTGEPFQQTMAGRFELLVTPTTAIVTDVVWGSATIGLQWEWSLLGAWTTSPSSTDAEVRHLPERVLALGQIMPPGEWARAGVYCLDDDGCLHTIRGACLVDSAPFLRGWSLAQLNAALSHR